MGSSSPPPAAPPRPVRLAILEADVLAPGLAPKWKSYGVVFTHLFERACAALDGSPPLTSLLDISSYNVLERPDEYPDPAALDAVLITGSKFNAFDDDDWLRRLVDYARDLLAAGRVRVVGVCFGHQVVARALGATVARSPKGWEISVVEHELLPEGRRALGLDRLRINQMHRDVVLAYPEGAVPLARTPLCETQAMLLPGRALSVQGHPEFTEEMVRVLLESRKYGGIIDEGVYEDGMSRVADEQDGVAVAQAFIRFMQEGLAPAAAE